MIFRHSVLAALAAASFTSLVACGDTPPAETAPPKVAVAPPPPETAPVATVAPPPEPTPEEKKKAADAKQLHDDRLEWEGAYKVELERWTPEMHKEAKALADKQYPTGKAAIQAAIAGKHRKAGNSNRDQYRHPVETLELFGFKPMMQVLDIGPGDGWYTELLAPALAKKGKYFATNGDPNGPADKRSTFYSQRFKAFLDKAPELYGNVQQVKIDGPPALGMENQLDMVLIMRGVHGMKNSGSFDTWLAEINKALKVGGVLGIEEHRAPADANPEESAKKGYMPEKWVIDTVEAAGFKLAAKSEINANAKDTKDYPDGVWTLPPTLRNGDKDKEKFMGIGESDRMTLKFVKKAPAKTAAPPGKPVTPTAPAKPAPKK